uniref:Uncharacterized protein n=1 Tax=Anguilla anguilla TaxID=7936 RepID=A0A0E9XQS2_ANGAN
MHGSHFAPESSPHISEGGDGEIIENQHLWVNISMLLLGPLSWPPCCSLSLSWFFSL